MKLSKEHLDELTAGYTTPEQIESLYSQMLQHMINRSLEAQMQAHLGHQRHGRMRGGQRPQWQEPQVGAEPDGRTAGGDAAGSGGHL